MGSTVVVVGGVEVSRLSSNCGEDIRQIEGVDGYRGVVVTGYLSPSLWTMDTPLS